MVQKLYHPESVSHLFEGWEETLIWSALQGIMGQIYGTADGASAVVLAGDFGFFGGKPDREIAALLKGTSFLIAVPQNEAWAAVLEDVHGAHARPAERYAIRKEPDAFDRKYLADILGKLPEGMELRQIDEALYHQAGTEPWCRDLVSQYPDYETYQRLGLGFVAVKEGRILSGASSYGSYQGGIEIEICTHKDYRRQGLALCCGAALILCCLERGLYPSWDAHNLGSVALAEKLGYHFSHSYPVYEIIY